MLVTRRDEGVVNLDGWLVSLFIKWGTEPGRTKIYRNFGSSYGNYKRKRIYCIPEYFFLISSVNIEANHVMELFTRRKS